MKNGKTVDENLINLISKIGEKITIRRSKYFDNNGIKSLIMFIIQLKRISVK